jgi:hypothetical protein
MLGKIIALTNEDDIHSLRDRLEWAISSGEATRLIIVLPQKSKYINSTVHFDLIRRMGQDNACDIAIVAPNLWVRRLSHDAGLPTYRNIEQAKKATWRVGSAITPVRRQTPPRRFVPNSLTRFWSRRPIFTRLLHVGVGLVTVAALSSIALALLPTAQVSLVASSQSIQTITTVALDARATRVNLAERIVPARKLETFAEGSVKVPTTGKKEVSSSKATGIVTFFNILNQPYIIPQNTVVRTSGSSTPVRFVTTHNQEIPPNARADVRIEANEEGLLGNVQANQINQVEGVPSVAVRVLNQRPTTGGSGRTVKAVSRNDYKNAKEALTQQLLKEATEKLQKDPEVVRGNLYLVPTSIFISEIQNETYDRFVTEPADELQLDLRIEVSGLAVSPASLSEVARNEIDKKVPRGFSLVEIEMDRGDEVEEDVGTRAQVFVTVRGKVGAEIAPDQVRTIVRGKTIAEAQSALQRAFSLQRVPQIVASPSWWVNMTERMPLVPMRIQVDIKRES